MPKQRRKRGEKPYRRDILRQTAFARHYLAFGTPTFQNQTAAALAAGYSETYAKTQSHLLPDRKTVQAEMKRIRDSRAKRSTIASPEEVLETVSMVMRTPPSELFDKDTGELIALNKLPKEAAQLVAGFKFKTRITPVKDGEPVVEHTTEYKITDRLKAADMLAKHHGLYEEDNRQKTPDGPALIVAYPTANITIEEWQSQVLTIMQQAHGSQPNPAALPAPAAGA